MKAYELVLKLINACGGSAHPQTYFEELMIEDPGDYVKMKHGKDFDKFQKEINGNVIRYALKGSGISYIYEFTEI